MAEIYMQEPEPPRRPSPLLGVVFIVAAVGLVALLIAAAGLAAHLAYDLAIFGWHLR